MLHDARTHARVAGLRKDVDADQLSIEHLEKTELQALLEDMNRLEHALFAYKRQSEQC